MKQFINSIEPSEILIQKRDKETLIELLKNKNAPLITSIEDWVCKTEYARDTLLGHFKIQSLKGFGIENENESIIASGIVMHYFKETQKANLKQIQKLLLQILQRQFL